MSAHIISPPPLSIARDLIVLEARKHLNTPFRHQGRTPGVGLDCIGLGVMVCIPLGIPHLDLRAYGRQPDPKVLMKHLLVSCVRLPSPAHAQLGSVLMFEWLGDDWPQHIGIKSETGFIHTYQRDDCTGKVCEMPYDAWYQSHTVAAFDFRGVA